jgi:hypothetical protein
MAVVLPGMLTIFVGGPVSGPVAVTVSPAPLLIKLALGSEGAWLEPPHDINAERSAPNKHNFVARVIGRAPSLLVSRRIWCISAKRYWPRPVDL